MLLLKHSPLGLLTAALVACAHGIPLRPSAELAPGIPNRPDLVTVILFSSEGTVDYTTVLPAAVDGHRGFFLLDMGTPRFHLNRLVLQPNAAGGVDTVTDTHRVPDHVTDDAETWNAVHVALRLGTLLSDFDDPTLPRTQRGGRRANATLNHSWDNFSSWMASGAPSLGILSLSVMEPFETIIDYTHKRVVFIRVDQAGHRLVDVPAYTPRWTAPLVDTKPPGGAVTRWAIQARIGGQLDTLFFDNGSGNSRLTTKTAARAGPHLRDGDFGWKILDSLVIAGRAFTPFPIQSDPFRVNLIAFDFLSQRGVVGFNHRAHQFLLYR